MKTSSDATLKLNVKKVKTAIIMGATGPKIEQAILSADEYSKENHEADIHQVAIL